MRFRTLALKHLYTKYLLYLHFVTLIHSNKSTTMKIFSIVLLLQLGQRPNHVLEKGQDQEGETQRHG